MNELTISLNPKGERPLYEQIYAFIKNEIQSGGLPFEERLPSTRMLAKHLQVSRSTVELAYEQLLSEGYVEALPYKGYFVCKLEGILQLQEELQPSEEPEEQREVIYEYDFSPSGIDLNSFPHNAWKKISKNILMEDNKELFQLGQPEGEMEIRQTIASYLHQARGVRCQANQVIVGAGNDYLLMLLCNMFGRERIFGMENPTYKKAYQVLQSMCSDVKAIPMDQNGIEIEELRKSGAEIAYVMPSHQYPLGTVMPIKRRMELLEWAADKEGRYIIEDDYDSEFRYKGKPIPALQGYDRKNKVIYLGTFSRSVAPSIRVSYMVLPKALLGLYQERGKIFSSTVSRVDQFILSRFLQEGYFERHLNRMRTVYKNRHDTLLAALQRMDELFEISGEHAGVHILLNFHGRMSEQEAIRRAKAAGVKVYPLSDCYIGKPPMENTVILGYANMEEEKIEKAAEKLCQAWSTP